MTPTDPAHLDALVRRAERGAPRGAGAVLTAARLDPLAGDGPPMEDHRTARRLLVAAAVIVVAAISVAVVARRGDEPTTIASDRGPYCASLAAAAVSTATAVDVIVYVDPRTPPAELEALADELRQRADVAEARPVDEAETYARFRELFADQSLMLETVTSRDLPTSIELEVSDPATTAQLTAELRARTDVFEVRQGVGEVRVIDLLVWPGADERIAGAKGGSDAVGAYGTDWPQLAAAVRRSAPTELADDIDVLLARLTSSDDGTSRGPAFADATSAATVVRADASDRCGLEVPDRFTEPLPDADGSNAATTEVRSGD